MPAVAASPSECECSHSPLRAPHLEDGFLFTYRPYNLARLARRRQEQPSISRPLSDEVVAFEAWPIYSFASPLFPSYRQSPWGRNRVYNYFADAYSRQPGKLAGRLPFRGNRRSPMRTRRPPVAQGGRRNRTRVCVTSWRESGTAGAWEEGCPPPRAVVDTLPFPM